MKPLRPRKRRVRPDRGRALFLLGLCGLLGLAGCNWCRPYLEGHPVFSCNFSNQLRTLDAMQPDQASLVPPVSLPTDLSSSLPEKQSEPPPEADVPAAAQASLAAITAGLLAAPSEQGPLCAALAAVADMTPTLPPPRALDDGTQEVSLEDARLAALSNNLDLNFQRVAPLIALAQINQQEGIFQPRFRVENIVDGIKPPPSVLNPEPTRVNTDDFTASVAVPLKTGGQFNVSEHVLYTDGKMDDTGAHNYDADFGFDFTQPLLRNGGVGVTTAPIQLARLNFRTQDAQLKLVATQVLSDVEQAYWRLWGARQLLEVAQSQVRLGEEQVHINERLAERQIATRVDLERARSELLLLQENALVAETNVRLTQRQLERIMQRPGLQVDYPGRVIPITPPSPVGLKLDRARLAEFGLQNRMELVQVEIQLLSELINIQVARNSELPLLNLVLGRYRVLGSGGTLSRALGQQFEAKYYHYTADVLGEITIGPNQQALARIEAAVQQRFQTSIDRERVKVQILQDINNAADQMELAWERVLVAQAAVKSSALAYRGAARRYPAAGTLTDVLLTRENLGTAQSRVVQAVTDYQVAVANLALATGTMLGYGQVQLGPLCSGPNGACRATP